ncbi:hypothetical protein ACQRBR_04555 [Desulfovibrio sp. SGI.133]
MEPPFFQMTDGGERPAGEHVLLYFEWRYQTIVPFCGMEHAVRCCARYFIIIFHPDIFSEKQIVRAHVAAGTAWRRALWQDRPAHADASIEDGQRVGNRQAVFVAGGKQAGG